MHYNNMKNKGFTLIEILVVLAIIATLLSIVTPRYFASIDHARESTLKYDLVIMREAIDKFYSDTGRYPDELYDLVDNKYLRSIPQDPITESTDTWVLLPPADSNLPGQIYDIRSGSTGIAADGSYYEEW